MIAASTLATASTSLEARLLTLIYCIDEPITPLKRFQKLLYVGRFPEAMSSVAPGYVSRSAGTQPFEDLEFPRDTIFLGPNSDKVTLALSNLAYEESLRFDMTMLQNEGGPHSRFELTARGKIIVEEILRALDPIFKQKLQNLASIYHELSVDKVCKAVVGHYLQSEGRGDSTSVPSVTVSSASPLYAPVEEAEELKEASRKLSEKLKQFRFAVEQGDLKPWDGRKYVPLKIQIDPQVYYEDIPSFLSSPDVGPLLRASCESPYLANLYDDGTFLLYYRSPIPTEGEAGGFAGLVSKQHFRNMCQKALTSVHLATYTTVNPEIASIVGARDFSYIVQ